jgi:hypothetical protein
MDPKKIAKLSREEKLMLLDLIEEKKRRLRESRAVYTPNEGQFPIHKCKKRIRAVFSGNGSGKSCMLINEVIWAAQGYNPILEEFTKVPAKIIIVLDRPEKVDEVFIPELQKWFNLKPEQLHKDGRHYVSRITFNNGSQVRFTFHLMEPMSFESIECDYAFFDEPPPRPIFIALMRGGRTKGRKARFLIVGTPISGSWLREDIYDPWVKGELPDTECFRFGTMVNQHNLSNNYIEDFSRHLSEKEKRIRLHGEFFDLDGLALAHLFKRQVHVIDKIDEETLDNCIVAIDPHPNKSHVAILIGTDRDGYLYVLDEYDSKEVPRVFARSLKKLWWDKYKLFDIVCDSLGSTAMSGGEGNKSFIQVLNEEGVRARPTTFQDKDDESWIIRIQNVLAIPDQADNFGRRIPKLRILNHCIKTIHDIETVSWQKYKNIDEYRAKLDISSKDYLAALKYGLACNLMPGRKKTKAWRRNDLKKIYR